MPPATRPAHALLALSLAAFARPATAQVVDRVSVPNDPLVLGIQADQVSSIGYRAPASADGRYVVFVSTASTLIAGAPANASQVYLRDRQTGTLSRLTELPSGFGVQDLTISADGSTVAFRSNAVLVDGDDNVRDDVFVIDRISGAIERISNRPDGQAGNQASRQPSLSADGRRVVFSSSASDLVEADTSTSDVFLYDRDSGTMTRISSAPDGTPGNAQSSWPEIAADGATVCFESNASNLVAGDTNGNEDVFLYRVADGSVTLVSRPAGGGANGPSYTCTTAAGSGEVAFLSDATNLVAGDGNDRTDAFVVAPDSGSVERVSLTDSGAEVDAYVADLGLSDDGRLVAFEANSVALGGTAEHPDLYLRDRDSARTLRISQPADAGTAANGGSSFPRLLADGSGVVFSSQASNLIADDRNARTDVLLWRRDDRGIELISRADSALPAGGGGDAPVLSGDGEVVAFVSSAPALLAEAGADVAQAFVYRRSSRQVTLASRAADGTAADAACSRLSLSRDGRWLAFETAAGNLAAADHNGQPDVYLADLDTGAVQLLSHRADGAAGSGASSRASVSGDGSRVAFVTDADDLVADGAGGLVWNRADDTLQRFDRSADGTAIASSPSQPALSADGEVVAFVSSADGLVPGTAGGRLQIYRKHLASGAIERLSRAADGSAGNGSSAMPAVSADGSVVSFVSTAGNLPEADGKQTIYVYDDAAGVPVRISPLHDSTGYAVDSASDLSADGRFVSFGSYVGSFVPGDTNGLWDVFVADRLSGRIARASIDPHRQQIDGHSQLARLSADGQWLAFRLTPADAVTIAGRLPASSGGDVLLGNNPLGDRLFEDGFGD